MSDGLVYLIGRRPIVNCARWSAFLISLGFGLTFGVSLGNFLSNLLFR